MLPATLGITLLTMGYTLRFRFMGDDYQQIVQKMSSTIQGETGVQWFRFWWQDGGSV
jgi:hypothetical protein